MNIFAEAEGTWCYSWDSPVEEYWFEEDATESRLAKYWASEIIATNIFEWYWNEEFGGDDIDAIAKRMYTAFANIFPDGKKCRNYLSQLLKKEWFRS